MELINQQELKNILEKALRKLYAKDWYLLKHNCHERSITHKLAEYLQELLPDYNVDCEYNLDLENDNGRKKWISIFENIRKEFDSVKNLLHTNNSDLSKEIEKLSKSFYPDIIVHKRGSNKYNMLVVEAKKGNVDASLDIEKLKALTNQEGGLHYRYVLGAQVTFDVGETLIGKTFSKPIYYIDGQKEQVNP